MGTSELAKELFRPFHGGTIALSLYISTLSQVYKKFHVFHSVENRKAVWSCRKILWNKRAGDMFEVYIAAARAYTIQ
jgi:hypothetical protein